MDDGGALHVTNGDSTVTLLDAAGFAGPKLPWRDVLHEGPVPAGLDAAALRRARARYLEAAGLADRRRAEHEMSRRDSMLGAATTVVLWFEHDLYDQLQLIQILDALAARDSLAGVEMICVATFPGRPRFAGLGELTPAEIATLWPARAPVTAAQVDLGRRAWRAFRSPDPEAIHELLAGETGALPFLAAALFRHLESFPWVGDGLSRTERGLLEGLARAGSAAAVDLFLGAAGREEAPFLGDAVAWTIVRELAGGPAPLVRGSGGGLPDPADPRFGAARLSLTDDGRRVLAGEADRIALRGIDRWLGGVHLRGRDVHRFDSAARRVRAPGAGV